MSQYFLINRIKVQNANAIAGFTWGFPAITHFLGFCHNLARKIDDTDNFKDIGLTGCAVVSHQHHVHTYHSSYGVEFTQSRNPPCLSCIKNNKKNEPPPVIEEGKMNMTVSLLIGCEGNIGNREGNFLTWLKKTCLLQRLAGGTILDIASIDIHNLNQDSDVRGIKRKLLPGFVLMDRSNYLEEHYQTLQQENDDTELLDAWFDFSALKQKARPKSDQISKHLKNLISTNPDDQRYRQFLEGWEEHLKKPYQKGNEPDELKHYFNELEDTNANKKILDQWKSYCSPAEVTDADWEYIPKPNAGYLVPIMTGYKAISEVYKNHEIENTRDNETDVCFVESVHSIGEWLSVHRLKDKEQLNSTLWYYQHEENWYLCKQKQVRSTDSNRIILEDPDDDFS